MKCCLTVVFLSVLAISHSVEAKPAEAPPDLTTKTEITNGENVAPPKNEKPLPDDVHIPLLPVGGPTKADPNGEGATLQPSLRSNDSTTTTTITSTIISSSTNATDSTPVTAAPAPKSTSSATSITTIVSPTTSNSTTKTDTPPLPTTSSKPSVTSPTPFSETSTQSIPAKDRRFDGPSFIGGIVLSLGTMAIGFVAFKFYKARTERNYHTL